jgi:hypothetical protein
MTKTAGDWQTIRFAVKSLIENKEMVKSITTRRNENQKKRHLAAMETGRLIFVSWNEP